MEVRRPAGRWLIGALVAASVVALAWPVSRHLGTWTRHALRARCARAVADLPDAEAAAYVRRLAALDAEAPAALVPLLADRRTSVAAAAEETLLGLLADWQRLPDDRAARRAVALAHELARAAPHLPPEGQALARDLAARLLVWKFDNPSAGNAALLADCEAVLRMSALPAEEMRIAAVPAFQPPLPQPIEPQQAIAAQPADTAAAAPEPPAAIVVPAPAPAVNPPPAPPPFYGRPREPERLIDASRERPEEPRQLRRPKAMKIEG